MQTGSVQTIGKPNIDDTRFDHGVTIVRVDLEDLVHLGQANDDGVFERNRATRQTCFRTTRHNSGCASGTV